MHAEVGGAVRGYSCVRTGNTHRNAPGLKGVGGHTDDRSKVEQEDIVAEAPVNTFTPSRAHVRDLGHKCLCNGRRLQLVGVNMFPENTPHLAHLM